MKPGASSGSFDELLADPLEDLLHLAEVGVVGDLELHLHDRPVAAVVGDRVDAAERNRVDRAGRRAQRQRARVDALDVAADAGDLDVFVDPEGIVEKEEQAGDQVLDEGLRAEADGQAEDPGAGEHRADIRRRARRGSSGRR